MITADQLTAEVLRLADEHPDAVYERDSRQRCRYSRGSAGGGVGCLFGQALTNLGVTYEELERADADAKPIKLLAVHLGITKNAADIAAWQEVQNDQDGGWPWGTAVESLRGLS